MSMLTDILSGAASLTQPHDLSGGVGPLMLGYVMTFVTRRGAGSPPRVNLWGWWDAASSYTETSGTPTTLITTNGTAIGSLKDLSGNGRHFYQPVGGSQLIYQTAVINSLPIARNTASNFMTLAAIPTNPVSIYMVVKQASFVPIGMIIGGNVTSPSVYVGDRNTGATDVMLYNGGVGPTTAMSNGTHLIGGVIGTASADLRLDAGAVVTASVAGGGGGTGLQIVKYDTGTAYWLGDIAEILVYTGTHSLTTGYGQQTQKYLNTKYNLGLTP